MAKFLVRVGCKKRSSNPSPSSCDSGSGSSKSSAPSPSASACDNNELFQPEAELDKWGLLTDDDKGTDKHCSNSGVSPRSRPRAGGRRGRGGGGGGGGGRGPNQEMTSCRFSRILHFDYPPISDLFNYSGCALNLLDFKPGAFLSKRFGAGRKSRTNDLHRSNSFKFERFERPESGVDYPSGYGAGTLQKQISLCDDYCVPVDFVNKRRPLSLGGHHIPSPDGGNVEIIENYSDPRDSKAYLKPGEEATDKLYSSPNSKYSHPCQERKSDRQRDKNKDFFENVGESEPKQTPYYYGDIHKIRSSNTRRKTRPSYRKSVSLDTTDEAWMPVRDRGKSTKESPDRRRNTLYIPNHKSFEQSYFHNDCSPSDERPQFDVEANESYVQVRDWDPDDRRILDELDLYEMTRQRHVYETAFDSQVSRSDEETEHEQIQRVASSSSFLGHQNVSSDSLRRFRPIVSSESAEFFRPTSLRRPPPAKKRSTIAPKATIESFNDDADSLAIDDLAISEHDQDRPTTSCSTNASPSRATVETAPAPPKFHSQHSIASAQSSPGIRTRIIDDSADADDSLSVSCSNYKKKSPNNNSAKGVMRPRSLFRPDNFKISKTVRGRPFPSSTKILEIKSRPEKMKYSSTESVTCSSSGGSLESIRSSTSEDNRSTTSTGSHLSSSLSSNSSESTNHSSGSCYHCPITLSKFSHQQSKLHILSPISDKSSQEPASEERSSETSENRNPSQKASPEDMLDVMTPVKELSPTGTSIAAETSLLTPQSKDLNTKSAKKRTPFKKNLAHLNFSQTLSVDSDSGCCGTNQNSDSGISIESKCSKSKTGSSDPNTDFLDLPFDMPKLRRRRLQMQPSLGVQDTSSSATSVDIKDLPFDMPKLRRRLRNSNSVQTNPSNDLSLASSSNSVQESADPKMFTSRTQLTLNLGAGNRREAKNLDLNLKFGEVTASSLAGESFDVTLPLERQAWYHGSITRVEAENILRNKAEGSYLVRNSESSRLDFSLSLKSARGFMHMRIQRDVESNQYILGHFSNLFVNVPSMIHHYSLNRIPIRGAEHMRLLHPVPEQLL